MGAAPNVAATLFHCLGVGTLLHVLLLRRNKDWLIGNWELSVSGRGHNLYTTRNSDGVLPLAGPDGIPLWGHLRGALYSVREFRTSWYDYRLNQALERA